jgi:hypothetical protein
VRVTPDEFVSALVSSVFDSTVKGVVSSLESPPGRSPHGRAVIMHEWFVGLAPADQRFVGEVVRDAAHSALFGVLCVLDGVRVIDAAPHVDLALTASSGEERSILNEDGELHDRLNALVHPPSEDLAGP